MINLEQQNILRNAFAKFETCYNALVKYSKLPSEDTVNELCTVARSMDTFILLPSGRVGNILAVALEMKLYPAAKFLIENAQDLKIDLNCTSNYIGGRNDLNAYETFCLANNSDYQFAEGIDNSAVEVADKLEGIFGFRSQR